jgi:deoxyribodipyrimidine photo-lyase
MGSRAQTVICLLRNDLRVGDNEALVVAHRMASHLVPLYSFDPDHFKGTWHFGFPKTGPHRTRFLLESVADLRENLRKLHSDLVIEHSRPLESIKRIVATCKELSNPVVGLVYQTEVTFEEVKVEKEIKEYCESQGVKVTEVWGSTMYHQEDIPYKSASSIPDTYTQFRKEVEAQGRVRAVVSPPDRLAPLPPGLKTGHLPTLAALGVEEAARDPRTAFPFPGGESAALARLQSYLWETRAVATYKETRARIHRSY